MNAADDYLHQAADTTNWPAGIRYDPENDGTVLASLGTHEHWNDSLHMQYSRNLGTGNGIELVGAGGTTSVNENQPTVASQIVLYQNYPNPFNPSTKIGFRVWGLGSRWVKLAVYDVLGREVAVLVNEKKEAGNYEVQFDGTGLSSGVYFYRIQVSSLDAAIGGDSRSGAGDFAQTRRLNVLR
jgi:hypothetical protein